MDSVFRGVLTYLFVFAVFRVAGRRSLIEATPFDLALLLIISEVTQQAMVDDDHSMINGMILIITLVGCDVLLSWARVRFKPLEKVLEEAPLVIVDHGKPVKKVMAHTRVDEADVLQAARETRGLERMEQIKYAVLEPGGGISVIPLDRAS